MRNELDPEPFAVDAVLEQIEWEAQKEETRKRIADLNAQYRKREAKIPIKRNRLWQAAAICFGTVLAALLALHWWLDGILRSIGL